ncbi:MAG: ketopantoate reductase family protein [Spirochaetes bacterium]|nr:ketopantoate reductase family protein [Spirochaetota bacterium]
MKKIAIVGCGAMGTILGAFMAKNGHPVEMVDANKAHVDAMKAGGAKIIGTVDFTVPVDARLPEEMDGIYDLVFVLTKQTANEAVFKNLMKHLGENSIVCTLQNGIPEPAVAGYVGAKRTMGGTSNWGATYVSPGISELTQDLTKTPYMFEIGEFEGPVTERTQKVREVLEHMGWPSKVSDNFMPSRWAKLVLNSCGSGMSAVCGITFGEVMHNPLTRACACHIAREVLKGCNADGLTMPVYNGKWDLNVFAFNDKASFEKSEKTFLEIYGIARSGKASMLQDLEKGLKTEVRMINGHVSATGDKHGFETPFCDKVVDIVTRIENGELKYSMDNVKLFEDSMFDFKSDYLGYND